MSNWEINFKPTGVSIKTMKTRSMINPETNELEEIATGSHRTAIAVGNFETAELFTAHVTDLMAGKYGAMIAEVASESMLARDKVRVLEQEAQDREALISKQNIEVDAMVAELDTLRAEVQEVVDNAIRIK